MQIKLDFLGDLKLKVESTGDNIIVREGDSIIELRNGEYVLKITAPFECEKVVYHVKEGQSVKRDDVVATLIKANSEFKTILEYDPNHTTYDDMKLFNIISKEVRLTGFEEVLEVISITEKKSFKKDEVIFEAEDDKVVLEYVAPYDIDSIDMKINIEDTIENGDLLFVAKIYEDVE